MANTLQTITAGVANEVGDADASVFDEQFIAPLVKGALQEFTLWMRARAVQQLRYRATITVPASTTAITKTSSPALPSNLLAPTDLWEAPVGATQDQYRALTGPRLLPRVAVGSTLTYWNWVNGQIALIAASQERSLQMDYFGEVTDMVLPTDTVFIPDSVLPIIKMIAGRIVSSRGDIAAAQAFQQKAEMLMQDIASEQIKAQQSAPIRRRPFRSHGRYRR